MQQPPHQDTTSPQLHLLSQVPPASGQGHRDCRIRPGSASVVGGRRRPSRRSTTAPHLSGSALKTNLACFFQLLEELEGHSSFINCIIFDEEGQHLFSGDSVGVIRVWSVDARDAGNGRSVTCHARADGEPMAEEEVQGTSINHLLLHPNGRRLIAHCRDNHLRSFDLRL